MDIVNLIFKGTSSSSKASRDKKETLPRKNNKNEERINKFRNEAKQEESKKEKFEKNLMIINQELEEKPREEEENHDDDFNKILKNANRRAGLGFEENNRQSKDRKVNNLTKSKLLANKSSNAQSDEKDDEKVAQLDEFLAEDSKSNNFSGTKKVIGVQPPSKKIKKKKRN